MHVTVHPAAEGDLDALPSGELLAMRHAIDKLRAIEGQLGFPHSSNVGGADRLRELRPRAGRSPWRAFYRRIGVTIWIGSFGPEANADRRGFQSAVRAAEARLAEIETAAATEKEDGNAGEGH